MGTEGRRTCENLENHYLWNRFRSPSSKNEGIILFLLFQLMDYPFENIMVRLSMLKPIDLARVPILLKMDISALMGVSSAVFKQVFGVNLGLSLAIFIMLLWIIIPLCLSLKKNERKDL